MDAHVAGITAIMMDLSVQIGDSLPIFIGGVVVLSGFLLLLAYRSLVIPVKAAAMNLLSICAAYGVVVMVSSSGGGEPHRHGSTRPDRDLRPDDHVRRTVRAVDGLRGVPAHRVPGALGQDG